MKIAIDFDGTCVTHEFPKIGKEIGAPAILKMLVEKGHQLILFTMRADRAEKNPTGNSEIEDITGMFLTDAIDWFKKHNIPLYGIQSDPGQDSWTASPKAYANIYIDDASLGAPLIYNSLSERPYMDWVKALKLLQTRQVL